MSDERPPRQFSHRRADQAGRARGRADFVRRRGDESQGAIILKINRLDGTASVLTQARYGDEMRVEHREPHRPLPEAEADRYLEKQAAIDPDSWILEIEDRSGNHWFPGKIVKLPEPFARPAQKRAIWRRGFALFRAQNPTFNSRSFE